MNKINHIGLFIVTLGIFTACRTPASTPISNEVPPGYRSTAVLVPVAEAKVVHPRDMIDVLVTRPVNKDDVSGPRTAETILQNVLVLRIGPLVGDKRVLYVALNPYEAQFAVLEDLADRFHITVRPKGDTEAKPMIKIEARKLFR